MAPLIVITGPTASGKSSLAIKLAKKWGGEIVCADSRTVYKGMDIGTAKPSIDEQKQVPHHLLDIAMPGQRFTVHDFQTRAKNTIAKIRQRGNVPILVGGSGLYIDSVVLDYDLAVEGNLEQRHQLEAKSIDQLHTMLKNQRIPLPENHLNKRYLIRALEKKTHISSGRTEPKDTTYVVAIATEEATLQARIRARVESMFEAGVVDEADRLAHQYGWDCQAMTGNIYAIIRQLYASDINRQEAIERAIRRDRQLVKRQLTWLRRRTYVKWLSLEQAEQYFEHILEGYRDSNSY